MPSFHPLLLASTTMLLSPSHLPSVSPESSHHQTIQLSDSGSSQHPSSKARREDTSLTSATLPLQRGRSSHRLSSMSQIITPHIVTLPLDLSCSPPFINSLLNGSATGDNHTACRTSSSPSYSSFSLHLTATDPATTTGTLLSPNVPATLLKSASMPPQSNHSEYQNDAHPMLDAFQRSTSSPSVQSLSDRVMPFSTTAVHGI